MDIMDYKLQWVYLLLNISLNHHHIKPALGNVIWNKSILLGFLLGIAMYEKWDILVPYPCKVLVSYCL